MKRGNNKPTPTINLFANAGRSPALLFEHTEILPVRFAAHDSIQWRYTLTKQMCCIRIRTPRFLSAPRQCCKIRKNEVTRSPLSSFSKVTPIPPFMRPVIPISNVLRRQSLKAGRRRGCNVFSRPRIHLRRNLAC